MLRGKIAIATLCAFLSTAGFADTTVTAQIDVVQAAPSLEGVFIRLVGYPTINEPGCSNPFAYGNMNNDRFMIYVWPSILLAHSKGRSVTINFSGCNGTYPVINWIQVDAE